MGTEQNLDYLHVLRALSEIPFGIGKNLLVDFLRGDIKNNSIRKNLLDLKPSFGTLAYEKTELELLLDQLISAGFITHTSIPNKPFFKVLELTSKGKEEIKNPTFTSVSDYLSDKFQTASITDADRKLFSALDDFLHTFNDEQKKAITSSHPSILCVAGAGSGKTTVLTKRIQFLCTYRSVTPEKILAITFTRKARTEMRERLRSYGLSEKVHVETFNSFCERMLRKHADLVYDKPMRVITYKDKFQIISRALQQQNRTPADAINTYFNINQRKAKTQDQLYSTFVNDCFFIRDYFKSKNRRLTSSEFVKPGYRWNEASKLVYNVCTFINEFLHEHGLRDFMDQILDTISLFKKHPDVVPGFSHVLVDEYQDVNASQIEILSLLKPDQLFCVGDPRQAIYGWRGSDINYILNFTEHYPDAQVIVLTKNYRSTPDLVSLGNKVIEPLGLPSLESARSESVPLHLLECRSDEDEFSFTIQKILSLQVPLHEIFVLSRTNKQLTELSKRMKTHNIPHLIRNDDAKEVTATPKNAVVLATVHAIKGLEAEQVFVLGANGANFPCRGSDHPVIDMVTVDEYNKFEEERRVFYVGLTRAKKALYLTYTGKQPTSFLTSSALKHFQSHVFPKARGRVTQSADTNLNRTVSEEPVLASLKEWRNAISKRRGVKPYQILSNTTLYELAQVQPTSFEELEEIAGLHPAKIIKYGEQILSLLQQ